jgi:hypothetical protein
VNQLDFRNVLRKKTSDSMISPRYEEKSMDVLSPTETPTPRDEESKSPRDSSPPMSQRTLVKTSSIKNLREKFEKMKTK